MNTSDIARHRLHNQQIARQKFKHPGEVVAWLGAVQAQDFPGAKWSIALRLPSATDADIEQAVAERKIIRTWPMRGTLHFVAAEDVHWIRALLTPRIISGSAGREKRLELDATLFARCEKLFIKALRGGKQLSREVMCGLLEKAGISTASYRGYHILWRLAQEGLLCFGPPEGKQHTFVLLDEWVPAVKRLENDEALAELARRYFTSHGPATVHDFVWWSGLKMSDAKAALALAGSRLAQAEVEGKAYWMSPDLSTSTKTLSTAFLLPGFDEYMLGYTDRSASLEPRHAQKICPGSNGIFNPTVVLDGRVSGTWKRTVKKSGAILTMSPFTSFTSSQKRIIAASAEAHGRFLGMPIRCL